MYLKLLNWEFFAWIALKFVDHLIINDNLVMVVV